MFKRIIRRFWILLEKKVGVTFGLILSFFIGKQRAFKVRVFMFYIKTEILSFMSIGSSFWLGRSFENDFYSNIIWISPEDIKYVQKDGEVPFIESGDWDLRKRDFELHPTIVEMCVENKNYKETAQYKRMLAAINNKTVGASYWCENEDDLDEYFDHLGRAIEGISEGEYKTQDKCKNSQKASDMSRYPNEIIVSIDRDGKFLHEKGGSHRLSIAKVFNIEKVPVVVLRRHYLYVKNNSFDWRGKSMLAKFENRK